MVVTLMLAATLVAGGKSDYAIVAGTNEVEKVAADEIREIVARSTGVRLPIGDGAAAHRIFVGYTAEAEKAFGRDDLGENEYAVSESAQGDIWIRGEGFSGTALAAYAFLEDVFGYRMFTPEEGGERIVRADTVDTHGYSMRRTQAFPFNRGLTHTYLYGTTNLCAYLFRNGARIPRKTWAAKTKYRDIDFPHPGKDYGHGFSLYMPCKRLYLDGYYEWDEKIDFFKTHPEWYSMDPSGKRTDRLQLCFATKEMRAAFTKRVLERCRRVGGEGVLTIGANDVPGAFCWCPDCKALQKKYETPSGAYWDYLPDLCNAVAAEYPKIRIMTLAYRKEQTENFPKGIERFPDNFICDFAPVTWDRSLSEVKDEKLPDGRVYDWLQNCRDWCKACPGGLSYWYYGNSICAYTWGRMSKELGEIHDAGVRSAGYCGLEGGFEFEDLMHHMWFWCLYHPHGDARAEFARAAATKYGPATDEILAYADALEKMRQRVVATTPCGPTALDILSFASADELKAMGEIHDRAAAKAKGTKYAENVAWARISLDVAKYFKDGDAAAEARARTASKSYLEKVRVRKLMRKGNNPVTDRLDQMANYANLKSDALPPELAKYPREKVTRVLPAKSQTYTPWGRPVEGKLWSEPDPQAVCGFAMADVLDDDYIPGGIQELRIGLYDHNAGKYLIPFGNTKFPKGFWKKDEYRMFCLGRSRYASRTVLVWTDTHGYTGMPYSPLKTQLLSRLFDTVEIDKQFETWISVKAQGPKFFPGDTRPNKVFIEQIFSVEL